MDLIKEQLIVMYQSFVDNYMVMMFDDGELVMGCF